MESERDLCYELLQQGMGIPLQVDAAVRSCTGQLWTMSRSVAAGHLVNTKILLRATVLS